MTAPGNNTQPQSVAAFYEAAVEQLNRAELSYGHGCTCPEDEVAWLISATLDVPFDELDKCWSQLLSDTELSTTGGTSDARFIAEIAEQIIELGPVNASIHMIDEHIELSALPELAAIYKNIFSQLLK